MTELDTSALLNRAQSGDETAQHQLLIRYRPRLERMVVAMLDARLSARLDPSDVLQDAFVIADRRLPEYLEERPVAFYPWLRQIVKDLLIQAHRRHLQAMRRSVLKEQEFDFQVSDGSAMQLANHLISRDPSPSNVVNQREMAQKIKRAMEQMSAQDQEVLLMRFIEQLSISEIGEALSISENTAKAKVRRAVVKLGRAAFGHKGSQP